MNQRVLMGPCGRKFLADAKRAGRAVFVWTVNDESLMRWSIERGVDAVLTDDPELFLQVCEEWESELDAYDGSGQVARVRKVRIPLAQRAISLMVSTLAFVLSAMFMVIHRARIRRFVLDSRYYQIEQA
jgi:phosphatidylglycerol phospholipase C